MAKINKEVNVNELDLLLKADQKSQITDSHKIFRLSSPQDRVELSNIISSSPGIQIIDELTLQLVDLIKAENPSRNLDEVEIKRLIEEKLAGQSIKQFGVWVHYPWRNCLVHLLEVDDFIFVRTVRNRYKITSEEQKFLRSRIVGIVGLSVGHAAALNLAQESLCGEIRIADFDRLELSNLNRIRTAVQNLNLPKTELVKREIAELDPFIKVVPFYEGLHRSNCEDFFLGQNPIHACIEECDSVDIKFLVREICKRESIPVLMETSDRGMIDIERYDLNPNYPILHGLVDSNVSYEFLASLKSSKEKLPYLAPFAGIESLSSRMKTSAIEVGETITTWPQLASDVNLGGAIIAHCIRQIFINSNLQSGRYWVDLEQLVGKSKPSLTDTLLEVEKDLKLELLEDYLPKNITLHDCLVSDDFIRSAIAKANLAPSPGNSQKWKWLLKSGNLFLFLDKENCYSVGDNSNLASLVGLGAALENLRIFALVNGYRTNVKTFEKEEFPLIAQITFSPGHTASLVDIALNVQIEKRRTNRFVDSSAPLTPAEQEGIKKVIIENRDVHFDILSDQESIKELSQLCCEADKIRLMNSRAHFEFFSQEIRWNRQDLLERPNGISIEEIDLTPSDKIGLKLASDPKAIEHLRTIEGGSAFRNISFRAFENSSALGIITISNNKIETVLNGGATLERIWLRCTELGLSFHPMTYLFMFFSLELDDVNNFLSSDEKKSIQLLRMKFHKIFPGLHNSIPIFLFRLHKAKINSQPSVRISLSDKLLIK